MKDIIIKLLLLNNTVLSGAVRHLLTLAAGWLISQGWIAGSDQEKVVGFGLLVWGAISSAMSKAEKADKKLNP